ETMPQITGLTVGGSNELTTGQQHSDQSVAVSGTVTGTFEAGDKVTLEVGNNSYTGAVGNDGSFSINVSGKVLAEATSVTASVTASDGAGHTATVSQSDSYVVDQQGQGQNQQGQQGQGQNQHDSQVLEQSAPIQVAAPHGIASGTSSGSDLSNLVNNQNDVALNVNPNGQGAGSSSTLHINDVVASGSGDLLQNLAVAGGGSPGTTDGSTSAAGSGTGTPATTPETISGSALMDPELLKSIVAAVTPPPAPGHH
ncbi:MAG: hypothetical protein KGJ15_05120, partial [Betaproteobacteria bacterium]|nr:hypothetical protein [Betaproteobacteria bacterium]MDE2212566.1 hypothetical protein [Betaproteobacteria bacterium]